MKTQGVSFRWQDLGLQAAVARVLECIAMIASRQRNPESAAPLFGAADALRLQTGSSLLPNEQIEYEKTVEELRNKLGNLRFKALWSEGKRWTVSQAVASALALPESPPA